MQIEEERMQQEQTEDWIEYIINITIENYRGRDIVIWGRYGVSDNIKDELKEKYGIDIAFYIDSDLAKTDGKQVFSPDCLSGKSDQYYVVIPIAFYQAIREKLSEGGYSPDVDYYYFCDCVLRQEPEYYEDLHGNKIIGNYRGLKFVFSGFRSIIQIGDNVSFQDTCIYVHNNSKIVIGNESNFQNSKILVKNFVRMEFDYGVHLFESNVSMENNSSIKIERECDIQYYCLKAGQYSNVQIGNKGNIKGTIFHKISWILKEKSRLVIGSCAQFESGVIYMLGDNLLKFGKNFAIRNSYDIRMDEYTCIMIGDDCLFSREIMMRSNDGHSIFDVTTGQNINSTPDISKTRRIDIGNHVWIGMRATILYHTIINDGSIVGAMSLVKDTFPNNCIIAGVPAKVIRKNIAWCDNNCIENIMECGEKYINYTK